MKVFRKMCPGLVTSLLILRLVLFKVTINCAGGCWHSKFDIYLKQVTVQQHMNEIIHYTEPKKLLF